VSLATSSKNQVIQIAQRRQGVPALLIGIAVSVALIAYVLLGGPGKEVLKWLALIPALIGVLLYRLATQTQRLIASTSNISEELRLANETLRQQVQDLTKLRDAMMAMGATFDRRAILDELIRVITELMDFDRGLVLLFDKEKNALTYGAYSHAAPDADSQFLLEQLEVDLENPEDDPLLSPWMKGQSLLVEQPEPYLASHLNWLLTMLDLQLFYSVPLRIGNQFRGVLLVDNSPTRLPIATEQRTLLDALAAYIAITLENARLYQLTDEQLTARVQELEILSRIDRELNYTLSVDRIVNLVLDWALRFTATQAAAIAMVDSETRTMRFVTGYGYAADQWEQLQKEAWSLERGITGRVARHAEAENVLDVSQDPDYVEVVPGTLSQLSVPITREDRVLAVLSLESQTQGAFTDANVEFTKRLAARAATAIDNANLFDETRRERRKLELILSSTADAVIVVGDDGKLVLVNQAALAAYRLPPKENYVGRPFDEVFAFSRLLPLYERALKLKQILIEELTLPDDRTFHVSLVPAPEVGWTVVSHDITPFKETDKLKNELVATTSHDLKNPLGTIMGYIDLVQMTNKLNEQGIEYIHRVHGAVAHMRQLIDDLLDMARIESGIVLRYSKVHLPTLLDSITVRFVPQVKDKAMTLQANLPSDLPPIPADEARLSQILNNLVSNAIKYTPPEGHVWVRAETRDGLVQIVVQDDGMGISPEDQAHVFDRFYRVRTPETDGIEGTGLGLAIVKSLVELHGGQVGLESRLGEGTTFYFTLPLKAPDDARWVEGEE
jgi:signal transduction histidine kinase